MTKAFIGIDSLGVPCVKITKGTLDPQSEPDANKSSFLYNSKFASDVKLAGTDVTPYEPNARTFWPAGSNDANYTKKKEPYSLGGLNYILIRNAHFPDLPYDLPIYDIKYKRLADNRFVESFRNFTQGASWNGAEPGYRTQINWYNNAWWANYPETFYGNPPMGKGLLYYTSTYTQRDAAAFELSVVVWRLPGNNVPLVDSVTPVLTPGLRTVEITSDHCRVAKPGYDVRTATPTQLAFDSAGRPLSVIKAGDVALPTGVTEIEIGFPVDNTNVCDILQYENNVISYPVSGYFTDMRCEYWFAGTKLYINNLSAASRARFLVFSVNANAPTSGSNDVFHTFNDGTQDVTQFLRPGSGDPPALADIVLDSRWPAIQILAEGYQPIAAQPNYTPPHAANPGQSFDVNFDGTGFFPFVKYSTVHQHPQYGLHVKMPSARLIESYNNSNRYNAANTSFCILQQNKATFWTYEGNPHSERHQTGFGWVYDYIDNPMIGLRYFILGIPQT